MKLIRVGAAVLNQTPLDWDGNRARIIAAIEEARRQGVSLLCLPELCITGYGCEDAFHAPHVARTALAVLRDILPATRGMAVAVGLPLRHQGALYNTACMIVDGVPRGFTAKQFLAGDGIHYEPRWFKAWPEGVQAEADCELGKIALGDLHYLVGGVKVGFEICEDAWVANRPGGDLALKGVDVILNPSASHFAFGKMEVRKRFVLEGSRAFGVTYVYSNLLGNEAGRAIYDGGVIIASAGTLLATGRRFSFEDFLLTSAVIDVEATRRAQTRSASFRPDLREDADDCVTTPLLFPECGMERPTSREEDWEGSPHIKMEEFTRAECLALYDYCRKSRSRGFVLSLSGGADSSAIACIISMLVEFGVAELGRERFLAKLPPLPGLATDPAPRQILHALLACAYQAAENSSATTRDSARKVAEAVGAEFFEFDIADQVKKYVSMIEVGIGRKLEWKSDDLALQNIQARTRGPGIWMLTNIRNALLLATSNRSEAAVGYATMDGDTCGGLSPLAGIDKAFLLQWLSWLQSLGPAGLHPIPELDVVTKQRPTAELRPKEMAQTDEDDLMPFPFLDAVERSAIRDGRSPVEIFDLMLVDFPQYTAEQKVIWIERFFRLWFRNQWKRERYAPSFHLDDENLDPKTWCRFPILSGGFDRELKELRCRLEAM